VILILDGHSSRWDPVALHLFKANNVHVWVIASHTSAWGQVACFVCLFVCLLLLLAALILFCTSLFVVNTLFFVPPSLLLLLCFFAGWG